MGSLLPPKEATKPPRLHCFNRRSLKETLTGSQRFSTPAAVGVREVGRGRGAGSPGQPSGCQPACSPLWKSPARCSPFPGHPDNPPRPRTPLRHRAIALQPGKESGPVRCRLPGRSVQHPNKGHLRNHTWGIPGAVAGHEGDPKWPCHSGKRHRSQLCTRGLGQALTSPGLSPSSAQWCAELSLAAAGGSPRGAKPHRGTPSQWEDPPGWPQAPSHFNQGFRHLLVPASSGCRGHSLNSPAGSSCRLSRGVGGEKKRNTDGGSRTLEPCPHPQSEHIPGTGLWAEEGVASQAWGEQEQPSIPMVATAGNHSEDGGPGAPHAWLGTLMGRGPWLPLPPCLALLVSLILCG